MHEPQPAQRPCWGTEQFAPTAACPMAIPAPANQGATSVHKARAPCAEFKLCVSDPFIILALPTVKIDLNRCDPHGPKCDRFSRKWLDRIRAIDFETLNACVRCQRQSRIDANECAISHKSRQMTQGGRSALRSMPSLATRIEADRIAARGSERRRECKLAGPVRERLEGPLDQTG